MRDSFSGMKAHPRRAAVPFVLASILFLPHVDLTRYGSGDQGRSVSLQPLDCFFDFCHHVVDLGGFAVEKVSDDTLFGDRRNWQPERLYIIEGELNFGAAISKSSKLVLPQVCQHSETSKFGQKSCRIQPYESDMLINVAADYRCGRDCHRTQIGSYREKKIASLDAGPFPFCSLRRANVLHIHQVNLY